MKVFIADGTEVIGRQLVPRLVDEGHDVAAISRSESGATAELCDVLNCQGQAQSNRYRRYVPAPLPIV